MYNNKPSALFPPPSRALIVLALFATSTVPFATDVRPVPPDVTAISVPVHVPVVIVPRVVIDV